MRKFLVSLSLLLIGLSPAAKAGEVKMKPMYSVEVRGGMLSAKSDTLGSVRQTKGPALDLDVLRHVDGLTLGLGLRNRKFDSAAGQLTYNGLDFVIGRYSNLNKERRMGGHLLAEFGAGTLSGVGNGYIMEKTPVHFELRGGLDFVLMSSPSEDPSRRASGLVASLDLGMGGVGYNLRTSSTAKGETKMAKAIGPRVSFGLRYDF